MEHLLSKNYVQDTWIFYSTAFFIASNYKALLMMVEFCKNNNKLFGFNFAAEFIYKYYKDETFEMIENSDFIFCNKMEAIACSQYFYKELGIEHSEDDTLENLQNIANAITKYENKFTLKDKVRPRVMLITNSGEPVVVSVGPYKDQE